MGAREVLGKPQKLTVGGVEVCIAPLPALRILALVEDQWWTQQTDAIRHKAQAYKDNARREAYIDKALSKLPVGPEMEKQAHALLAGAVMPKALAYRIFYEGIGGDSTDLTFDQACRLFDSSPTDDVRAAMDAIAGKAPAPASRNSARSRKSTASRRSR